MDYKLEGKVLPLGSVVLLKNAEKYIVVIGYAIKTEGEDKIWDYLGCAYPFGVISSDSNLLFDSKEIGKVIFTGFSDEEGERFREQVSIGDER